MTRPAPRRSALAQIRPAAPNNGELVKPASTETEVKTKAPVSEEAESKAKKVGFYLDDETADRMRAAVVAAMHFEGHQGMSAYLKSLIVKDAERLEQLYNNGEPFPPVQKGHLRGRPIGS